MSSVPLARPAGGVGPGSPPVIDARPAVRLARARRVLEEFTARCPGGSRPRRLATGLAALDDALGGGLPLGALCEIVSPRCGCRALSLGLWLARSAAASDDRPIFLIDPSGEFYPPAAAQLGVSLDRLVCVRAPRIDEATWAAEQILRCRRAGPVVARFSAADARAARRLQLAAEASGALGVLVHHRAGAGSFAAVRIDVPGQAASSGAIRVAAGSRGDGARRGLPVASGDGPATLLLRVRVVRRGREPGVPVLLEWADASLSVHSHAVPGDRPGERRRAAGA